MSYLIRVPRHFFDDHWGRELPTPVIQKHTQTHYWIDSEDPALPELLNDAEFYAHPHGPDAIGDGGALKRSAKATVSAIKKATEA